MSKEQTMTETIRYDVAEHLTTPEYKTSCIMLFTAINGEK